MSEILDGYLYQQIKEFWMNPTSLTYSHHSLCKEYTEFLEKKILKLEEALEKYK